MPLDFPANPTNGQMYGSYVYNSTVGAWQAREDSATVATISTVFPTNANPGDIWYDSDDGTSYIYYDDGTSAQWVELLSSGLPLLDTKADLAGATFTGNVTAPRFISTQTTGTAPLTVSSTTAVTNLNADLLDGQHATAFSPVAGSSSITTVGTITSGIWNGTKLDVASGGTGVTSLTSGAYLKGAGTAAITSQAGIPAGDITSGTLAYDRLPSGTIIQVVYAIYSGAEIGNSTSTYIDSGLSASITPRYSNSNIIIQVSQNYLRNVSAASNAALVRLRRGTTTLKDVTAWNMASTTVENNGPVSFAHQDAPATTSSVSYNTQFANNVNGPVIVANRGMVATMILMEVKV